MDRAPPSTARWQGDTEEAWGHPRLGLSTGRRDVPSLCSPRLSRQQHAHGTAIPAAEPSFPELPPVLCSLPSRELVCLFQAVRLSSLATSSAMGLKGPLGFGGLGGTPCKCGSPIGKTLPCLTLLRAPSRRGRTRASHDLMKCGKATLSPLCISGEEAGTQALHNEE